MDRRIIELSESLYLSLSEYQEIIVHAGLHKTGTSYIQSVMNDNVDVLESRGIEYPRFRDTGKYRAAHSIHGGNHSIIALNYEKYLDVAETLDRYVEIGNRCPTLLLSGEGFSRYMPVNGFLEDFLKTASGVEVRFIFYIRRPDHLIESIYAQGVKNRVHSDIYGISYRPDYHGRIEPFIEAVGKDNITVRPYNRKLWAKGDLCADFCETMGKPDLWEAISPPSQTIVNASLNRNQIFLLSQLESRSAKQSLVRYFDENPLSGDGIKYFKSPEERHEFNQRHVNSFEQLSDIFGLGDMNKFLGIEEPQEDADWRPYRPDWELLFRYLASFADYEATLPRRQRHKR